MAVGVREVGVTADLTLLVQRDAAGGLEEGAETLLADVDGVTAVHDVDVTAVTPRLNDLEVEAEVDVSLELGGEDELDAAARRTLEEGFGVTVERINAGDPR